MAYDTSSFKERLTDTFGFTIEDSEELARPASQTPAPPKERIKGSKENPEGTASTRSKAGDIEISAENEEALKNKIAEFKDKHPTRKAPTLGALKKVFRRGAGAFSTSFRPTITGGKPNSRNAWAMARVNKFLKMAGGGEVKESYRKADGDLLEEKFGFESTKTEFVAGRDCGQDEGGTFGPDNKCAEGYGRPPLKGGYTPTRPGGKFPKDYKRPTEQGREEKSQKPKETPGQRIKRSQEMDELNKNIDNIGGYQVIGKPAIKNAKEKSIERLKTIQGMLNSKDIKENSDLIEETRKDLDFWKNELKGTSYKYIADDIDKSLANINSILKTYN